MINAEKTLVQCDFDGTITEKDVSFMMLDAYADGNWRQLLKEYQEGKMNVGDFNTRAFSMVTVGRETLLELARKRTKLRPGFLELVDYCQQNGFRFVIVSNGLDFYIEEILKSIPMNGIEVHAAETRFHPGGLKVQYIGPDGLPRNADFKLAYTDSFLDEGYRVIYIGNGTSDFPPAQKSCHVFATESLLAHCQKANLDCTPFTDLNEVLRVLQSL
ncbi:MAG: MtnX-like HAD-IB family phosphatase [Dehalococcoidales bacterium]|nr:MtnX-like HAD-IB family phosphatase [Dehalococcoidales bacterium]